MLTGSLIATLDSPQRTLLRIIQSGGAITNAVRKHWDLNFDEKCDLCGELDGSVHQYFCCKERAHIYLKTPTPPLETLPLALATYGYAELSPDLCFLRHAFAQIIEPPWPQLPSSPGNVCVLFTDGSGCFPDEPRWRLASYAIIAVDLPDPIYTTALAGEIQMAGRAEMQAGLTALRISTWIHLHSDYQALIDGLHAILEGTFELKPNSPHADIWIEILAIVQHRPSGAIQATKVKAHAESEASTPWEVWAACHNKRADTAAKTANQDRSAAFMQLHTRLRSQHQVALNLTQQIQRRQLAVATVEATRLLKLPKSRQAEAPSTALVPLPLEPRLAQHFVQFFTANVVEHAPPTRFGSNVRLELVSWLQALRWPSVHTPSEDPLNQVSLLELLCDFCFFVSHDVPIFSKEANAWNLLPNDSIVLHNIPVGLKLRTFSSMLADIRKDIAQPLPLDIAAVKVLSSLGFANQHRGVALRPKLTHATQVRNFVINFLAMPQVRRSSSFHVASPFAFRNAPPINQGARPTVAENRHQRLLLASAEHVSALRRFTS